MFARSMMVLATLAVVAAGSADAQTRNRVGLAAGVNIARVSGDPVDDLDSKVGFIGGLFSTSDFTPRFSVESGLYYAQRGAKASEAGITGSIKLDYLEIPVLAVFRFPGSSNVTPFIGAGGAVAFKVDCGFKVSGGPISVGGGCDAAEDELDGRLRGTDFGLVGQAGVDIGDFRIAVRYNHGLSNMLDSEGILPAIRHRSVGLLAGYAIRLN